MAWFQRVLNTFRTGRLRRDLDRELAFHVAEREDALRADGLSDDEARRQARLQFGNPSVQIERTRDVDVSGALDTLLRQVRHAVRGLRRTPGLAFTIVATLALGIGANAAVFSVVDGILLQPLPYPHADRLVRIDELRPLGERLANVARIHDWNRLNRTFEIISGYALSDGTDTTRNPPERTQHSSVAPGFFELLGVTPTVGRGFSPDDHRFGGPTPILLSDRFWRRSYDADPGVVGSTIRIRDVTGELTFPIAGVMPESFLFLAREVGAWSPIKTDAPWFQRRDTGMSFVHALGRLKPGVTLEQARADLARVQRQLGEQFPDTDRDLRLRVTPLKEVVVGQTRRSLWLLFGAVSLLLLIACTNIAALLLARGAQREQEIAVRYALGGSRRAVVAQLLTEAAVLAGAGAAAGLAVAVAVASGLRRFAPELPRLDEVAFDGRILLYTAAATVVVTLACGAFPAVRSARRGHDAVRSGSRVSPRLTAQWTLVGVQVALSVTLLAGAGLLLRSFDALARVDRGFDASRALAFQVYASWGSEQRDEILQRVNRTLKALASMPGVEAAATAHFAPGVPAENEREFAIQGSAEPPFRSQAKSVAPSYFRALSIPVVEGQLCGWRDTVGPSGEVMVNRRFAERHFPGRSPVGETLATDGGTGRITGVVDDAREWGVDRDAVPTVYACNPAPNPAPWYIVRTSGDPRAAIGALRSTMRDIEPMRAVFDIAPLDDHIDEAYAQNRLRTVVLTLFAATALSLSCLGVYGTLSYVVRLRRREVGLRLALGAARARILRQFLLQGLSIAAAASVVGLMLSFGLASTLSGMLYGVTPFDPATLAGVMVVVLGVAAVAALVPAARAALLEPMRILRDE